MSWLLVLAVVLSLAAVPAALAAGGNGRSLRTKHARIAQIAEWFAKLQTWLGSSSTGS